MKRPPELSWQDKAILISLPLVVLVIFIVTNFLSQEPSVKDAFLKKQNDVGVRDAGRIVKVYPSTATDTARVRLKSYNDVNEYDFILSLTASDTFNPQIGELIQFYGKYTYDENGGSITVPYYKENPKVKGKTIKEGWAIYKENRYSTQGGQDPASSLPLPPQ